MRIYYKKKSDQIMASIISVFTISLMLIMMINPDILIKIIGVIAIIILILCFKKEILAYIELDKDGIKFVKDRRKYFVKWDEIDVIAKKMNSPLYNPFVEVIVFTKKGMIPHNYVYKLSKECIFIYNSKEKEQKIVRFLKENDLLDKVVDLKIE